jgi:hypothetical protein
MVLGSAAAGLKVHQRDTVAALSDQRWRIGLEEYNDDLAAGLAIAHIGDGAGYQAIFCLQLGDAALVLVLHTSVLVVALPAVVASFDPAALLRFQNRRMLVGRLPRRCRVNVRELAVERGQSPLSLQIISSILPALTLSHAYEGPCAIAVPPRTPEPSVKTAKLETMIGFNLIIILFFLLIS